VEVIEEANALAYYDTATITAVKSFIVQAPGAKNLGIGKVGGSFRKSHN
jgi:hypothetical protein